MPGSWSGWLFGLVMQQLRQHVRHHEIEVVGYTSDSVRVGIAFLSFE